MNFLKVTSGGAELWISLSDVIAFRVPTPLGGIPAELTMSSGPNISIDPAATPVVEAALNNHLAQFAAKKLTKRKRPSKR